MAIYNLTNLTDANTMLEAAVALNQLTETAGGIGVLGVMIYIGFLSILFFNLLLRSSAEPGSIAVVTLWAGNIVAGILIASGLLPGWFMLLTLTLSVLAFLWMQLQTSND